ncbi:MAG: hypothetical protein MI975_20995 [Cytophagales bacterium]|nr:hypothetical protein [Cytophagales bacterium]
MKHLVPKIFFIAILIFGISSFIVPNVNRTTSEKDDIGNARFNAEMDNGFEERELSF